MPCTPRTFVGCGPGAIRDVLVDVRRCSPSFGRWEAFELDDVNDHQLYCHTTRGGEWIRGSAGEAGGS